MAVTLASLLTTKTLGQIKAQLIATLQSEGVATSDWSAFAIERAFVEMEATALNDLVSAAIPNMAAGGYLSTASGDWLTLLASEFYGVERTAAQSTVGSVTLSCAGTAGPYTIAAGQLWMQATVGGQTFRFYNTTGGLLPSGGSLVVTVQAESSGAAYNVGAGTITTPLTPLPGMSCNNPATTFSGVTHSGGGPGTITPSGAVAAASWVVLITQTGGFGGATFSVSNDGGATFYAVNETVPILANYGPDAEGLVLTFANPAAPLTPFVAGDTYTFASPGTWYSTQGSAAETDDSLRDRCENRWPALGSFATADAYESLAKQASATVKRVRVVTSPAVAATVNLYLAGQSGTVDASVVAAVQDYVDERAGLTDLPVAQPASTAAITLTTPGAAKIRVKAENYSTAVAAAQRNVQAYIDSIPISDGTTLVIYSQVIEAILRESGAETDSVNGLLMGGVPDDTLLGANAVATWSQNITSLNWETY